ncbi:hypothetical protein [Amycolatopsis sp. GA6-003]|uniref:hypothetical protein n=1 Tax=Amycolatopsis sp. GA6-003 TaxID=2652444 RepID=UPI00391704F6
MGRLVEEIVEITRWTGGIRPGRDGSTAERDIGTVLPDDRKELSSRFPSGAFCDPYEGLEYLDGTNYRFFPAEGGLLPWGGDGQGGMFCRITDPADPNRRPVAYRSRDMDECREHPPGRRPMADTCRVPVRMS